MLPASLRSTTTHALLALALLIVGIGIGVGPGHVQAQAATATVSVVKACVPATGITQSFTLAIGSMTFSQTCGTGTGQQPVPSGVPVLVGESTVPSGFTASITCFVDGVQVGPVSGGTMTVTPTAIAHCDVTNTEVTTATVGVAKACVPATGITQTFTLALGSTSFPGTACGGAAPTQTVPGGVAITVGEPTVPSGFTASIECFVNGVSTGVIPGGTTSITPPAGTASHCTVTNTQAAALCTFTKGYYRNHATVTAGIVSKAGGTLTVGGTALTAAQVQAVLDATPGQRGNVSFTNNSLLNLDQQLITALLNVGGNVSRAPAAVQTAIAQAQAGIRVTVSGGSISLTTTLGNSQISSLTDILDTQFNSKFECSGS